MNNHQYDAVIVGGGHNGLVAACYLARAGLRVLILEKNDVIGGATQSKKVFPGMDARLSVYSYLISLLPGKILSDLGISLEIRRRKIASYTSEERGDRHHGLLISNESEEVTRQSFIDLTGEASEFQGYRLLQDQLDGIARRVWPTLLEPLPAKETLRAKFSPGKERAIWNAVFEQPLGEMIEAHLADNLVRGAVFTDAKISLPTHPHDPTLLQNRCFLYHVIGQGTGEWGVPVGGMGALVEVLTERAKALGVEVRTGAAVKAVDHTPAKSSVIYEHEGKEAAVDARYVLFNTSSDIANRCLPGVYEEEQVEGSVFKINMLLRRLPRVKAQGVSPKDAFSGTFHLHEGYAQMNESYRRSLGGVDPETLRSVPLPGEIYCHSLTDPSILSPDLQAQGYQTLTLFGLDVPYHWFAQDHDAAREDTVREAVMHNYLRGINDFIDDDIYDCLAIDANGKPCVEAKSPLDLEQALGLPRGNIFHGNLSWPFAERDEEVGAWGVETAHQNVFICGSSAKRGGAVSGIPGHNAAMKVLESLM